MKAVALSGGTTRLAALDKAKIIRKDEKGNPVEVPVQLKQMFAGKTPDVDLVAEDILFVPTSAGKNAAFRSMEAVMQLVTGVSVRATSNPSQLFYSLFPHCVLPDDGRHLRSGASLLASLESRAAQARGCRGDRPQQKSDRRS